MNYGIPMFLDKVLQSAAHYRKTDFKHILQKTEKIYTPQLEKFLPAAANATDVYNRGDEEDVFFYLAEEFSLAISSKTLSAAIYSKTSLKLLPVLEKYKSQITSDALDSAILARDNVCWKLGKFGKYNEKLVQDIFNSQKIVEKVEKILGVRAKWSETQRDNLTYKGLIIAYESRKKQIPKDYQQVYEAVNPGVMSISADCKIM
eukprot:Phypoly_transcript_21181.p1 GENE.Phypoly_transcript_21181~~Phypoly_transcript_21181.p1  ORF type:complete len:212 (+),score=39.72 Phypoly_transcript_21181:25-636(+)